MKRIAYITIVLVSSVLIISCGSEYKRNPGKIYAPDMTYSQAFDYYNTTDRIEKAGGKFDKLPVKRTIAREQSLPTHIGEFDTVAAKGLTNPYTLYANDLTEGKRLYMIHCGICHGGGLDGNGPLYASGKYVAMPANFKLDKYKSMPVGQMYHAIMYGKNAMGAYASQLDAKQRWQVIAYIKSEQGTANLITEGEAPKQEVKEESHTAGETHSEDEHSEGEMH